MALVRTYTIYSLAILAQASFLRWMQFGSYVDQRNDLVVDDGVPVEWSSSNAKTSNNDSSNVLLQVTSNNSSSSKMVEEEEMTRNSMMLVEEDPRYHFAQDNLLRGGLCGVNKCFYKLKVNPRYGYVAGGYTGFGREAGRLGDHTEKFEIAYNISKIITDQYHMESTIITPPTLVNMTPSFGTWLEGETSRPDMPDVKKHKNRRPRFANLTQVSVQMVEIIHDGFIFQIQNDKRTIAWDKLPGWLHSVITTQSDDERKQTLIRFKESVKKLDKLLLDYPCLWFDFQLFVRTTGDIVHFDLERCHGPKADRLKAEKIKTELKPAWKSFVWYVEESLAKGKLQRRIPSDRKMQKRLRKNVVKYLYA